MLLQTHVVELYRKLDTVVCIFYTCVLCIFYGGFFTCVACCVCVLCFGVGGIMKDIQCN